MSKLEPDKTQQFNTKVIRAVTVAYPKDLNETRILFVVDDFEWTHWYEFSEGSDEIIRAMTAATKTGKPAPKEPLGRRGRFVKFTSNQPRTVSQFWGLKARLKTATRGDDFVMKLHILTDKGGIETLPLLMGIESYATLPRDAENGIVQPVGRAPHAPSKLNDRGIYKDRLGW